MQHILRSVIFSPYEQLSYDNQILFRAGYRGVQPTVSVFFKAIALVENDHVVELATLRFVAGNAIAVLEAV